MAKFLGVESKGLRHALKHMLDRAASMPATIPQESSYFLLAGTCVSGIPVSMMTAIDKQWSIEPHREKSLMLAQREVAAFVCDAVNLEGIPFTLPEVQTLLDGVTVGGHKVSDQQIVLNQGNAWKHLFASIRQGTFSLSRTYACELHAIAAKEEALSWGALRSGGVTIAGTDWLPPDHTALPGLFDKMVEEAALRDDIYDRSIFVFLEMARNQFFYDVNKRMGRFMMNGLLLDKGYPAINLPARRQLEFNQLMLDFYASADQSPMNVFMRSCLDDRIIRIMREDHPRPNRAV